MTVREVLSEGRKALEGHETDSPQLDTALLLAKARGTGRERLYMDLGEKVTSQELSLFRIFLSRRVSGEPVAWITGVKEFWGLEFQVGPGVLCPRPDTEVLVEKALIHMADVHSGQAALHDCCCGPGTIALSLAVERPDWRVSGSDISEAAAGFFSKNNHHLCQGRVQFMHSDLMDGIDSLFNIIVSNPPYLTPGETDERMTLGWKEPELALNGGGTDGLDLIRRLVPGVRNRLYTGGSFLLEADPLQMPEIQQILSDTGFTRIETYRDLAGRERVIAGYKG